MPMKTAKSNKPTTPKEDAVLIFLYKTFTTGGENIPNDDGSYEWCSHNDKHIVMQPIRLARKPASEFYDGCDPVPAEAAAYGASNAFLVVARYSEGDTFGCTYGHVYPIGVFANETDARTLARKVEDGSAGIGYHPWGGWGSSLGSVEVLELRVTDS